MKIALFTSYSFIHPGGVQEQLLGQAAALTSLGMDVTIIGGDLDQAYVEPKTPWRSLGKSVAFNSNGSVSRLVVSPLALIRGLRLVKDYDLVHVHEPFHPLDALLILMCRKPIVATFHAYCSDATQHPFARYKWILKRTWQRIGTKLAVSPAAKQFVTRMMNGEIEIVPNGISIPQQNQLEKSAAGSKKPVILFLGRNDPRKGLHVLLEAFKIVQHKLPEAQLWIAGPGTEAIAGNGIKSFGMVSNQKREELWREASIFCSPATGNESFGIVLLESMVAGLPVVASDIDGYREVARNEKEAILVPPNDQDKLAEVLIRVLTDNELASQLRQNGYRRCREFNFLEIGKRLQAIYEAQTGLLVNQP